MPSMWVRIAIATKKEAQASQSVYLGAEFEVGSEERQVVTHRSVFAFLPYWDFGQKRLLRLASTSPGFEIKKDIP